MRYLVMMLSVLSVMTMTTPSQAHSWTLSMRCYDSPNEARKNVPSAERIVYTSTPNGKCWHVHSQNIETAAPQRPKAPKVNPKDTDDWTMASFRFPTSKVKWLNEMSRTGYFGLTLSERAKYVPPVGW